jgi:hypothetical protein
MHAFRDSLKDGLTRVGRRLPHAAIATMNAVANYLEVGHWLQAHGFDVPRRFATREQLFDAIAPDVQDARVLYLEFGVAKGTCTSYWSNLLRHPEAQLHGFDSFEGLPASWAQLPRGYFSTGGLPPDINDPRVRFHVGWFEDTLPDFVPPDHDRLVVIMDADLYSSTAFVLKHVMPFLDNKSLVYFDEFHNRADEMRAFEEFLETTEMKFRVRGATRGLCGVIFERVG